MINLKEIRKRNNLTQTQFAKVIGITQKTVSAYETKGITPSAKVFYKISKAFNIPLDTLIENHIEYNPKPSTYPRPDEHKTTNSDAENRSHQPPFEMKNR